MIDLIQQPSNNAPVAASHDQAHHDHLHEGPDTYWLFLKQTMGIAFIFLSAATAWLLMMLPLSASQAMTAGFGAGLVLFVPGSLLALWRLPAGKSLLGGGMVFLFLTLTAALFHPDTQPGGPGVYSYGGFLLCFALLALFSAAAHRSSSQSGSMVACLSGMYLLHVALPCFDPVSRLALAAMPSLALALWIWIWLGGRRGTFFPLASLGALYVTWVYLGKKVDPLPEGGVLSFLILLYCLLTACALQCCLARRAGTTPTIRFFVINAIGFAVAAWLVIGPGSAGWQPWIPAVVLIVAALLALLFLRAHPSRFRFRSPLGGQVILSAAAAIMLNWHSDTRLVLLVGMCLLPALAAQRNRHRGFRLMEHAMVGGAVLLSLFLENGARLVSVGPFVLSASWLTLAGTAALCCLLARLHHGWSQAGRNASIPPELVAAQELLALSHALAAAFLFALHTLLTRGDSEALPFLLAIQGWGFLGLSMALLSPPLTRAALMPVMMGHACYYVLPFLSMPSAASLPAPPAWQVLVLLFSTLALAMANDLVSGWNRKGEAGFPEPLLSALPYGAALVLASTLFLPGALPAGILAFFSMTAWVFFALSKREDTPFQGMKLAGFFLLAMAAFLCLFQLLAPGSPLPYRPGSVPVLFLFLCNGVLLEHLALCRLGRESRLALPISCAVAIALFLVGSITLYRWNSGPVFLLSLTILALFFFSTGYVARSRPRYYTALACLALDCVWLVLLGGRYLASMGLN